MSSTNVRASRHTLAYCDLCEGAMVICADCGNNCCNGGTKDVGGVPCGCTEAYADQDAYLQDESNVMFEKDVRATAPETVPFSRVSDAPKAIRRPDGPSSGG